MTYPKPAVQRFVAEHFIAVKLMRNNPADQPHFRAQRVIWTTPIEIPERRGVGRYQSPGYRPPALFLPRLPIGLARAQIAWARTTRPPTRAGPRGAGLAWDRLVLAKPPPRANAAGEAEHLAGWRSESE